MSQVLILVAAAGSASRMRGADKLILPISGEALLTRSARAALAGGARVLVTLPQNTAARQSALALLPVDILEIDASEGMAASLRAGAEAAEATGAKGLMLHLADMPNITEADIIALLTAFANHPTEVLRATSADGTPGHPVLFPARCFKALQQLSGDTGARKLLRSEPGLRLFALPGQNALTDLDSPEDWARWRISHPE